MQEPQADAEPAPVDLMQLFREMYRQHLGAYPEERYPDGIYGPKADLGPARPPAEPTPQPSPEPLRPVPTDAAERDRHLAAMSFTPRTVIMLAADPSLHDLDIVYTATWAPKIAQDMAARDSDLAFLSRDTLSETCGIFGQNAMAPGDVVERSAATIGLIRMVRRGTPGAVRLDDENYRGQATSWTLDTPLEEFRHVAAAPAVVKHAHAVTRDYLPDVDLEHLGAWLDPRHEQWAKDRMGRGGWRLVAALIGRFGLADVVIGPADAARLCGTSRSGSFALLTRLQGQGLAERAGSRWRVRLAHLHMTLDGSHAARWRQLTPGLQKARLHNRTWFSRTGRALRMAAHALLEHLRGTARRPGTRWDRRALTSRGAVIAMLWELDARQRALEERCEGLLAPGRSRQALGDPEPVPEPVRPAQPPSEGAVAPWEMSPRERLRAMQEDLQRQWARQRAEFAEFSIEHDR